ncbi:MULTISPECIES: hypothetical protein [unclassified Bradyrhizobium]
MRDDYDIFAHSDLWLAAVVACAPSILIVTLMIMSLIEPQFPG